MEQVFGTMGSVLGLDASIFLDLASISLWTIVGVSLLAGLSTMLGHVAILALNRISGLHLVTSVLLSSAALVVLHGTQALTTWAVATIALRRGLPLGDLVIVAILALSPLAFNVITALPHLGLGIGKLLEAWSYLIFWFGVATTFRLGLLPALGFTIAGWLVMQLLSRLAHRPISWVISHVWTLATGRPTIVTSRDVLAGMPIIPVDGRRKPAEVTP